MPKISVLLPVRNAQPFLSEAVQSIQKQSFREFELLLLYSPSSDDSRAVLEDMAGQDRRLVLMDVVGNNLAACLNEGLRAARGELVARMDADDVAHPERFARQTAAFAARPDLVLLGSDTRYIDAEGRKGRTVRQPRGKDIERAFYWGCPFRHPSVMMRRSALEQCGGYRPLFRQAEDYDLWLRLHVRGDIDNLPETLLYYRLHAANSIKTNSLEARRHAFFAQAAWLVRKNGGDDPLEGLKALPDPELLPLSGSEMDALYGRVLAGSAHLLGDTPDDPEGDVWWPHMTAITEAAERKKSMTLYHLRCAKFYAGRDRLRCLRHGLTALRTSPRQTAGYALTVLRQFLPTDRADG
ncbi:MAG: glycosyltransferase [Desulfovibrio sp.]|nr:glycosyltransferase [Desulfovibrio sp.]